VIAFEWNSLLVSDGVIVHEHDASRYQLAQPGLVEFVTVRRPTNEVGIRIDPSSGPRVVWPTRQEVHAATLGATDACPYCVRTEVPPDVRPRASTGAQPSQATPQRSTET
jgi:hypothetical protein